MNVASMMAGQVSEVFEIEGSYVVLVVGSVTEMPMEELREQFRENYIRQLQLGIFTEIVEGWRESADIQLNQRAINAA
jgi:hypothetical protein